MNSFRFKKGDVVKCIQEKSRASSLFNLSANKVYIVSFADSYTVMLLGCGNLKYSISRFSLVSKAFKNIKIL